MPWHRSNHVYYGPESSSRCDRPTILVISGIITFLFVVICIMVAIVFGITEDTRSAQGGTADEDPSVGLTLSPGATRDVSFGNSFFCNEVTLEANRTGATVYLITATPPLIQNGFTRNIGESISARSFRAWNYHLFPGTNLTTLLYIHRPPSEGRFFLYKGHYREGRRINTFSISCTEGYTRRYSITIRDEDDYYLVYSGISGFSLTRCTNQSYSDFRLNISASWFVHSTAGLTNAPQCSVASGRRCSLDVPADSNYRALIVNDLPTNRSDLSQNIDVRLRCSSTRGWAYAVVVLVPLLLVVGVIITTVILVVCCCCCWRKRDSLRATCCRRRNTQSTTTREVITVVQMQSILMECSMAALQPVTDDGQQEERHHDGDLTAAPPPSYKDSLSYPAQNTDLPPSYSSLQ